MTNANRSKWEYESESDLIQDFKKTFANPSNLDPAAEHLFESMFQEAVEGVAFQMHFESKHPEVFSTTNQSFDDTKKHSSSSHNDYGASSNKFLNCKCLNCEKTVSANKFASHLENCMGLGRNSSRIASRKKTTNNSYYDPDDPYDNDAESNDANWTAKEKTKKKTIKSQSSQKKSKTYM
ncbi:CLUMA_CG019015, isoform A [Clunio marinus]|uniref:SAGA-associated factor 11 n=1 Tax=Clunio marinus TaxID=568069 RepID=A0A1J1J2G7_9DIPT|nr:CLUMA_CG019015, isoform A [Clunio marinus]